MLKLIRFFYPILDEQAGEGGAGAGAPAAGAGATPPGGAGAGGQGADAAAQAAATAAAAAAASAAAAGGDKPGEKSILSQGKDEAGKDDPLHKPSPATDKIPEKYRVYTGEGDAKVLDVDASLVKLAEAHGALETRLGTVGAPPAKAEEYKIELPADSPLKMADFEGPGLDAFKKQAHENGYTQKQFDAGFKMHLDSMASLFNQFEEKSAGMAKTELQADPEWAGDKLVPMTKLAYRTFAAFATAEEMQQIDRIGNNPVFLKVLARAGKDLGEDRLNKHGGAAAILPESDLAELTKAGSPYWDKDHADHQKFKDRVTRHHQMKYGTRPVPATT